MDNGLCRNDLQSPDHFLANLGHAIAEFGANTILALQTMLHLLNTNTPWIPSRRICTENGSSTIWRARIWCALSVAIP